MGRCGLSLEINSIYRKCIECNSESHMQCITSNIYLNGYKCDHCGFIHFTNTDEVYRIHKVL